ncbi:uncharacterized protein LOC119647244 isoform X2 [Hermetia illucens]|uniref:uncharacterized protein LOC119647244 isoform X2 n=1 Tax=Hermetia illucens TaxID=343691 RepID=UPI0018CC48D5|nr:uncharacterized protein LOC119647244 isoform X2 [Hermetia illucens]
MKRIRPKAYEIEISPKILERMLCAVIQWLVFSAAYSLEFGSLKMVGEVLSIVVINRADAGAHYQLSLDAITEFVRTRDIYNLEETNFVREHKTQRYLLSVKTRYHASSGSNPSSSCIFVHAPLL